MVAPERSLRRTGLEKMAHFKFRRVRRILLILTGSVLGLTGLVCLAGLLALRGSLPRLDGELQLEGLDASVSVTRDALGVVDIQAQTRLDAALALGYLHTQDRFFQMDLQRRKAAGELAALLGPALLDSDRDTRRHRFRMRAEKVLAALGPGDRAILAAYTQGVNAGLDDLKTRPFEYLVLREKPRQWRPADTILTLDMMCLDLSLSVSETERNWATVCDQLPPALAKMLLPRGNRWEVPLENGTVEGIVLPTAEECDVRKWKYSGLSYEEMREELRSFLSPEKEPTAPSFPDGHAAAALPRTDQTSPEGILFDRHDTAGSNNWAVAGSLTGHGGALLANDMHLGLALPNIWYRARMSWKEDGRTRFVVGATLPGAPVMVVGSNGHVAWGFTNSSGDWADLVILEGDQQDSLRYRTPEGWERIQRVPEIIEVSGSSPDTLWVEETIWGPLWTKDTKGRSMALRWTAHDTEAVNLNLLRLESASSVDEVVAVAGSVGIPAQNLVCADSTGRIAWALAGRIPRRVGWDGRLPVSWADGRCRWDGYLDPARQPRLVDPPEGRLWTANNRVTAGQDLALIGDGGYALGARARQIRDDLRALERPREEDMLQVQLDDRALFLEEWRDFVVEVLERELQSPNNASSVQGAQGSPRYHFLHVVRDEWSGHADVESVSYLLVRNFAFECVDGIYDFLTAACKQADPRFKTGWLPYLHAVSWKILHQRPAHLLPPWCESWDDFVLQAVDRVMAGVGAEFAGSTPGDKTSVSGGRDTSKMGASRAAGSRSLSSYTWGSFNRVDIVHPFVHVFPWLRRWLAAPRDPLPGDSFMPRVQHRRHGASERMVVSPGHEERGIFHMPGGQSGHPLSPFFLAGHEAWVEGNATSLLPGTAKHRLELVPLHRP